jgi:hypothetical protein
MLPKQAKNESICIYIYIYIFIYILCHLGALNGKIDLIFGIYIPVNACQHLVYGEREWVGPNIEKLTI